MFFVTVRASTLKFCSTLILGVLLVTGLVFILPDGQALDAGSIDHIRYDGIEDQEDMASFLAQFGWMVAKDPLSDDEVTLPQNVQGVFAGYNELQKSQGLDLTPYGGKRVRKVVFLLTNHPNVDQQVLATLFIYRNKVIAGDIASGDPTGFVHPFESFSDRSKGMQ